MSSFEIRVGDRLPWLAYSFGVDLSAVLSATFSARDRVSQVVFINDAAAVVANGTYTINGREETYTPEDGVVFYQWEAADTSVARASIECLFHLIWPGTLQETYPSSGFVRGVIRENF